jgi:hypothetical protein
MWQPRRRPGTPSAKRAFVAGLSLSFAGCAPNAGWGPWPQDAVVEQAPQPPTDITIDQLTGGFVLVMGDGISRLSGTIHGGKVPGEASWILSRKADGCLISMQRPSCQPACTGSKVCSEQLQCEYGAWPMDVGAISVTGVGPDELTMTASDGSYLLDGADALPYPPCSAGASVDLAADGGQFGPFTLTGECIAPLVFDSEIKVERHRPATFSWTHANAGSGRMRVQLALGGASRAPIRIVCDVDDTGQIEISAELLEQLIKLGVTGIPTVTLTRLSAGTTDGSEPRQVFLSIQHSVVREFEIASVTCANDTDCPPAQICYQGTYCRSRTR